METIRTIERIIESVCAEYGVTEDDIKGKSREQRIVDARMTAIYLSFHNCTISITDLADIFNRARSTTRYGIDKAESLLKFDKVFKLHYLNITEKLGL